MPVRESIYFLAVLLIIFFGLVIFLFAGFLAPLVFGVLLAGISYPFYRRLTIWFGDRKNLAALATVSLIAILILLPATGLLTLLTKEALELWGATRDQFTIKGPFMDSLNALAFRFGFDLPAFLQVHLAPALQNASFAISQEIGGVLSNALQLAFDFFVMIVTIFYLLRDGKAFGKFLIQFSPLRNDDDLAIYRTFKETGLAVFLGNFASALFQGFLGGIGFFAFGVPSPVLWGTVMAFLALIPFLGPYIIFLPAAAYLLISGKTMAAIIFLLYNFLIVSTVDNFIKPKLISDKTDIHPLLILLSILGGLKVFGIIGIIYGPLIVAIFLALLHVYLTHAKKRETHTADNVIP